MLSPKEAYHIKLLFIVNSWGIICSQLKTIKIAVSLLPAATKLGQGNVFTGVCDSVHGRDLPQCMLGCQPPPDQADPPEPGRPPWDQADPPGPETPPQTGQATPLDKADTPIPGRPPRDQRPPRTRQTPPLGSRRQHTVNERPVRILLECILVYCTFIIFDKMPPKPRENSNLIVIHLWKKPCTMLLCPTVTQPLST